MKKGEDMLSKMEI